MFFSYAAVQIKKFIIKYTVAGGFRKMHFPTLILQPFQKNNKQVLFNFVHQEMTLNNKT